MAPRPVIVIGTGFGGLAAAIRLRARGYRVVVLEALPDPGGRARVFERDGFVFDAGPTVITAPHLLDELFTLVGRDRRDYFELVEVDPFYRIDYPDGSVFDYVGDEERLLEQIRQFNPRDVDGYRALADHARRIFEVGYEQLADVPFDRITDMLRVVPHMARLRNYRSVYGLVSSYIEDDRLRQAFTFQPLLIGGNPFRATSIYLLIHWLERKWGVHFALGGTGSIVGALVQLAEEIGVEFRFDTPAETIDVRGGRAIAVLDDAGRRTECCAVVANADPTMVYSRMIDPRHRRWNSERRLRRVRNSMGLFVGYLGTKRTWPELKHHTIVLGPRYRGLLDDIFVRQHLADDFSLYLHAPTRTDSSMAPEGHENLYVLSPVPNLLAGVDWQEVGDRYFDTILAHLEERMLPGLRESITTRFHVTPEYFRDELRSADGAAFGPEPVLTQSAWFRFHNRCQDVEGLYFVGAGTHPGAGVPGVLSTARVLDRVMPNPPQPEPVLR